MFDNSSARPRNTPLYLRLAGDPDPESAVDSDIGAANHRAAVARREIMELENSTPLRRHVAATGTFANRRSQYVPTGNITAIPSSQAARAAV